MTKKRIFHIGLLMFKKLRDPYYQGVAAELAFFFLLSLVPTIILLAQLLGLFSLSVNVINEIIAEYVSTEMAHTFSQFFVYRSSGAISVFFLVFAIWAASKAQYSMMRITNYSFTGGKSTGKGYFRERLRAMKTVVLTIFTLGFSLLILVYGEVIIDIITSYVTQFLGLEFKVDRIWYHIRWFIAMGLFFFMISYIYYVLPSQRVPFKKILPGSVMASSSMLIATGVYSYYATTLAHYDLLYGGMAAIVALLLWFYLLGYLLVLGTLFNVAWEETKPLVLMVQPKNNSVCENQN